MNILAKFTLIVSLFVSTITSTSAAEVSVLRKLVKPIVITFKLQGKEIVESTGSGVIIAPNYLLTAYHVVSDNSPGSTINIGEDRLKALTATILKKDPVRDLALLQVNGLECPCAKLLTTTAEVDEETISVGYPLFTHFGVQFLTFGHVQGYREDGVASTGQIAPGSSGGGLFVRRDKQYKLAGLLREVGVLSPITLSNPHPAIVTWMTVSTPSEKIQDFLKGTPAEQ
jgi:S1-C subfamily serine protease